jgi:uncharacterized protein (UPF0276 family)
MATRREFLLGAGLRTRHFAHLLQRPQTKIDWFEAISENFMNSRGRPLRVLETIRQDYPVALHGVSLSIASTDGLDAAYLRRLADLIDRIDPFVVSDHLCFSRFRQYYLHDLLPFPLTERALDMVARNVDRVQTYLGRRIALENASVYLSFTRSEMSEAEFMRRLVKRTGCGILLDLNNLHVNLRNTGADPYEYFEKLPASSVLQMHLAGYSDPGTFYFDTHSAPVHEPVWDLFRQAMRLYPMVPVCIEWDENIPEFEVLEAEVEKARRIRSEVISEDRDYPGILSKKEAVSFQTNRDIALNHLPDDPYLDVVQRSFCDLLHTGVLQLKAGFRPAGEMKDEDALRLYASGYVARREEVLTENYRGTLRIMGEREFYKQVHAYLSEELSRQYDLNRFGRSFPEFLRRQEGSIFALAACCADLDRAFVDVFHEPAGVPFNRSLPDGQTDVLLSWNPSLVMLALDIPVYDLWKKGFGDVKSEPWPDPSITEEEAEQRMRAGREHLLVYRREEGVFVLVVSEWQFELLSTLKKGYTLMSAIERHEEEIQDPGALAVFFRSLVNEAILVDVQPL